MKGTKSKASKTSGIKPPRDPQGEASMTHSQDRVQPQGNETAAGDDIFPMLDAIRDAEIAHQRRVNELRCQTFHWSVGLFSNHERSSASYNTFW